MSSSATVGVEKATSDLLIGPDWTMNIDICDSINSHRWQAKDVIKVLKKRLQHKSPKVQLLALTLLETMIKNCGDNVHFQIAEKNILHEMIKIVRKKADMHVRDKILVLIDSWQEAFGGAGGKYPQYYWAYEELRRSGVQFPQRSRDAVPIFTPPVAHPMLRHSQAGYGMPSDTSRRLDEAMASEMENLSLSNLESMQSVLELLADMLQAVNPSDRQAVKDEVIVDLVSQCRSNQSKLVQMLSSTGDEELLCQGLALNDSLQSLVAKHDAIASGSPLPTEVMRNSSPIPTEVMRNSSPLPTEVMGNSSPVPTEVRDASLRSNATPIASASVTSSQLEEDEEEDDDFAQLARRRTKISAVQSDSATTGNGQDAASPSTSSPSNALVLITPPTAVRTTTTKEQDMIDLLSITLSTTGTSPRTPPSNSNQNNRNHTTEGYSYRPQLYSDDQGQASYSSYIAPWAQPQSQPWGQQQAQPQQPQSHPWAQQLAQPQQPQAQPWSQPQQPQSQPWTQPQEAQPQPWSQSQAQSQPQQLQSQPWAQPQRPQSQPWIQPAQPQSQPWAQPAQQQSQPWARQPPPPQPQQPWAQPQPQQEAQSKTQAQPQSPETQPEPQPQSQQQPQPWAQPQREAAQQSVRYPPPPWATAPASSNQSPSTVATPYDLWTSRANSSASSYMPTFAAGPLQTHNSFPARRNTGQATVYGGAQVSSPQRQASLPTGQKQFIPSYRLFEDLNVLGSADAASNSSPKMSGQSMVGGRK